MRTPLIPSAKAFAALTVCVFLVHGRSDGAAPEVTAISFHDDWSLPGILGTGLKANDAYLDANVFLTLPVYSTLGRDGVLGGDVIFVEPYTSWGEQGEVAMSLGAGWRHLFCGQSVDRILREDHHQAAFLEEGVFIGANLFADLLDTEFDNRFWQLGFGLEAGSRYVELRANYYLPLSDRQLADEVHTSTPVGTVTSTTYAEPFATGHTVQQDVIRTSYALSLEQLFRRYEEGMEGWDVEMALLVPWVDRYMDVKLIGGYYAYDNQPFGPQTGGTGNVEGWKAGVEVRPVPALVLTAAWFEDERLTGSDWIAGVRLELPFEMGDVGDGKGFWGRISDAFKPRRRHLAERLAEPVRRQNAAIKIAHSVEEDQSERQIVTEVVSQTSRRIVLANSVIFVDNAIGNPANPGTYERPTNTIQQGEDLGNAAFGDNAIVFVQGRSLPYTESVTISQGVRLVGSSYGLPALGGKVFHGRTNLMPLVNGGFLARDIAGRVSIAGFEIIGGVDTIGFISLQTFAGIAFENVAEGAILGNVIHGGILNVGIFVATTWTNSTFLEVEGNRVSGVVNGILFLVVDYSHLSAVVQGNTVTDVASSGIIVGAAGGYSTASFDFIENLIMNCPSDFGINVSVNGGSHVSARFIRNTVVNNYYGIVASASGLDAVGVYSLDSNIVTGNATIGVAIGGVGSGTTYVTLSGNIIGNNGQQIWSESLGGDVYFISTGTKNNTVFDSFGSPAVLYRTSTGTEHGDILINGLLHPASLNLP